MAISIDWGTSIISVPQSYLTLISGVNYTLDTNQFRLDLKDLEDDLEGMPFLKTHDHNPPLTVGGVTLARTVEILSPYTVTFEDGQYRVVLQGSNNNVLDVTNINQVSVSSTNSAGLVTSAGIEALEYDLSITIDVVNGNSGTVYPFGTARQPVNNLADAKTIATAKGFAELKIIGNITFGSSDVIDNFTIVGQGADKTTVTLTLGVSNDKCVFSLCTLQGDSSGKISIVGFVHTKDLTGVSGNIHGAVFEGTLTLAGSTTVGMYDCSDGFEGFGEPIIKFGGSGRGLNMRNYRGGLRLEDKSGTEDASIGFGEGRLEIAADVTDGMIIVRGVGEISENSGSATINDDGLVNLEKVTRILGLAGENQKIVSPIYTSGKLTSATYEIYEDAALTILIATYTMTAAYTGDELTAYELVEV